ncbi:MFS transporter [Solihabitans fulvus]|uniref:MFS transporter n=1 Tax=Solihabitans fulvus TaxID=1892852 RepID=A0A5B2WT69_9PSEU|nr:MFS transporter [Solihabitans fulvus]KAA2253912.1 MFS transporter [Solihabitans fulvus]
MTVADEAPGGVLATLRGLPRPAALLLVGVAINRMGSFIQIYLVLYLTGTGVSPSAAGLALTAYGAGALCGVFLGGVVTDRFGARRTIGGSTLLGGALVGALPFVHAYPPLVALCAAAGLTAQAYLPAASSLLAAVTPARRLVMVSAVYRLALNLGAMLGPLIGAALAALSYRVVFLTNMGTSLVFGAVALAWLPRAVSRNVAARTAERRQGGYRVVLRDRRYLLVVGSLVLMAIVECQYLATLPLQLHAWGMPTALYGALVATNALLVILFELPLTKVVQTWPLRRAIPCGVGLIATGVVLYGVRAGIVLLVVATVVRTLGEIAAAPSLTAYPAIIAPPEVRGRYIAALGAAQSVGYAVGPALGAVLFQYANWSAWAAFGAIGVGAVLLALLGVRQPDPVPARPGST